MAVVLGLPAFSVPCVCQMILQKVVFVIEFQLLWPGILAAVIISKETFSQELVNSTTCHCQVGTVCVPMRAGRELLP